MLLIAITVTASCSDDDNSGGSNKNKGIRRTVVMYVSAENSLGYNGFNKNDSTEIMAGSQFLNERDQLIMYIDDAKNPRIYRFYKGCKGPSLIKRFNENLCSSDPHVLRDILEGVKVEYPSESYGLVLWSHADGWLPSWNTDYKNSRSFGIDVGTGGSMRNDMDSKHRYGAAMDIDSIAWAIDNSNGFYPDYIFFDACFMQCIEVAYALRNVTDYIVACPISTPAIGANYTTMIRNGLFSNNPGMIAESYFSYMNNLPTSNIYNDFGLVISCIKTSELDALAAETQKYISKLPIYSVSNDDGSEHYNINMEDVTHYGVYKSAFFYRPHYYDLNAAMKRLLSASDYTAWKRQLDKCIVYKNATQKFYVDYDDYTGEETFLDVDLDTYCGISAFIPQDIYTQNANRCIFGNLNEAFRSTEWYANAGWNEAMR